MVLVSLPKDQAMWREKHFETTAGAPHRLLSWRLKGARVPLQIREYMFLSLFLQPNTFQLVIAYDPSRYQTFGMYIYKDMGWDNWFTSRRSMIGYFSYKHSEKESLQLAPSMKPTAFRMDTRIGNTGMLNHLHMFQFILQQCGQGAFRVTISYGKST